MSLRDYLGVLWRHKWIIVLVLVVASVAAYANAARQTRVYEATVLLIYERPLDVSNPLSAGMNWIDPTQQDLDVKSVRAVIQDPSLAERVRAALGDAVLGQASFSIEGAAGQTDSNSDTTNLATITGTSSDPQQAARIANAYATAFIAYRREAQQEQVRRAETIIKSKLRGYGSPATHMTSEYVLLRQRLQDLQILEATVTGDFRVVAPAQVPTAPIAPRPFRSAVLGFGVGLFAGIGLAFVLEQFNTRVADYREVAEALNLPVLGRVPSLPSHCLEAHALVVIEHPDGRGAEAFRMLRGNLEFVSVSDEDNTRSIVVTSALQGEGKSTTVATLGATLALGGRRVVVVDADLRIPRIHRFFGIENDAGVTTVLSGQAALDDVVRRVQLVPGACPEHHARHREEGSGGVGEPAVATVSVLCAGPSPPNPGELIASQRFGTLIAELEGDADVVLIDTPALLAVGDAASLAKVVGGLLMVVDIHAIRRPTLHEVRYVLEPLPCRKLGVAVVREHVRHGKYYRYGYYDADTPSGERRKAARWRA
jgi:Mrp family chromosome partitioning ATPase/capsular polysaccharide biosynthesis protein